MRYTLIDNKGNPIYRGTLTDIDKYTVDTKNVEKNLSLKGISINNLKIHYQVDSKDKYLDVIDEKYKYLLELRRVDDNIDVKDGKFYNIVLGIFNKVKADKKLLEAIKRSRCVNDKVVEKLEKAIIKNDTFNFDLLLKHLSAYKQLRQLVLFVDEYKKEKNNISKQSKQDIVTYIKNDDEIEDEDIDPDDYMYDNWEEERRR